MTTATAAVQNWSKKALRNAELVARQAIQETATQMTTRQPGVKETGGTFEIGKVPVDESELINSQVSRINGGEASAGQVSYAAIVAGLDLGDTMEVVFTAEHARPMEYGFTTRSGTQVPGRFFVREALQNWPETVAAVAAQLSD